MTSPPKRRIIALVALIAEGVDRNAEAVDKMRKGAKKEAK